MELSDHIPSLDILFLPEVKKASCGFKADLYLNSDSNI